LPKALKSIDLKEAQNLISVIVKQASKDGGSPVAVAVVGIDGRLVAFAAMDGVMPLSTSLARKKAYTAIVGRRDTNYWDGKNFSSGDGSFVCLGGGAIIEILSKETKNPQKLIIGAVGISGRTSEQDQSLANRGKNEVYANT